MSEPGSWFGGGGATYVIGDIHGCFETLRCLFERLELDPDRDRLWLAGDLVNRGPSSLEVLRWAREMENRLGERFATVLGNHDLRLLAMAAGVKEAGPRDTLERVFAAPDGDALVSWMRDRPLLHDGGGVTMIHAGLLPAWTGEEARRQARLAEEALQGPQGKRLLIRHPTATDPEDPGIAERRRALDVLTRLRSCTLRGEPCDFSGPPGQAPEGCVPWFEVPDRRSAGSLVVCGHWAALGLHLGEEVIALDTGCVWGGALTAVRLEDRRVFSQELSEPGWTADRLGL